MSPLAKPLVALLLLAAPPARAQFAETEVSGLGAAPLLLTAGEMTWQDLAPAETYNVYRRTPGDGFRCLELNLSGTAWTGDPDEPPPGAVWWYTVNGEDGLGQNRHGSSVPIVETCACSGVSAVAGTALRAELVAGAGDFNRPVHVSSPPQDPSRIFVTQLQGQIGVVHRGELMAAPFLDVGDIILKDTPQGEEGLFTTTFHPDYAVNGLFYISYTGLPDGQTVVERYRVSGDPDLADPDSGEVIYTVAQPSRGHNGGHIAFGPDGYLYIALGDGGGDDGRRARDPGNPYGAILRIDVDSAFPYAVPPDNPFVGVAGAVEEIWVYGLRNPFRFTHDPLTGDLYIGDVGDGDEEEIDVQPGTSPGGEDFGWNMYEGNRENQCNPVCDPTGLTFPVVTHDHVSDCGAVSGIVYRGCRMPDLHGTYFYADYCPFNAYSFVYAGGAATEQQSYGAPISAAFTSPAGFGVDARGDIYWANYREGTVYRFLPE